MATIINGSGDSTFGGTIQSTGIDDNATSTAITIDSAEHVSLAHGIGFNGDTAAANALDDYEEGTWTPSPTTGTATFISATYTKIGRLVMINIANLTLSDYTSGSSIILEGLPFESGPGHSVGSVMVARKDNTNNLTPYLANSISKLYFYENNTGSFSAFPHNGLNASNNEMYITVTYTTNS